MIRETPIRSVGLALPLLVAVLLASCVESERTENEGRPPPGDFFAIVHIDDDDIDLPAQIEAGTVSFEVENNGAEPHGFAVEGEGVYEQLDTLDPLERGVLTVTLAPGTYTVYSPRDGDGERLEAEIEVFQASTQRPGEQPGVGPSDAVDPIEDEGL